MFLGTQKETNLGCPCHKRLHRCLIWLNKQTESMYYHVDLTIVTRNGSSGNTGGLNRNLCVTLKFTKRPKTPGIT